MARSFTPKDCHSLMNLLVKEATGQDATIQVVDTSSFVSAGETVLSTGTENVLNALSIIIGKTFMSVRPYDAKLQIINAMNTNLYSNRVRKISFYAKDAEASGDFNTDLHLNLAPGYQDIATGSGTTGSVGSQWEQNPGVPLEMNFAGQSVWQDSLTVYENQLKIAFTSESEFAAFMSGILTERGNDIESQKEAYNRMTILNHIAGIYDMGNNMPGSVINLTAGFNSKFGTNYTSAQLRTTYLKEFLEYFVSIFKLTSDYMTNRSKLYHWSPAKTVGSTAYTLLRHTPKSKQKALLYSPLFTDAKAQVMPEIFNPQYLDVANYEGVTYWQNINNPSAIKVTPAVPNKQTGEQVAGNTVDCPYVVGMIFDTDAMMIDYQLDTSRATPVNARKGYHNIWWTFSKNAINDFTENAVIFVMEDPAA